MSYFFGAGCGGASVGAFVDKIEEEIRKYTGAGYAVATVNGTSALYVALGLAGLLFFKYSIEQGLITQTMRVVLGTVVGLACLVGSEWLRRRDHRVGGGTDPRDGHQGADCRIGRIGCGRLDFCVGR